jgi:serine/threonine protein kinase
MLKDRIREEMIHFAILKPIEGDERFYNLAPQYWVYNELLSNLRQSGWVRFAPGFKGGLYGHPTTQYNGKRVCIKILGMGVGQNPLYFCEKGFYLEHERNMLLDFRDAGFMFAPAVLEQKESINFLIKQCNVQRDQAEWRVLNNDLIVMEYISGIPFVTQTGRFLNYIPNIIVDNKYDLDEICSALESLSKQLNRANDMGLLHNDVMPPNIIFTLSADNKIEARLVDFELAQNLNKISPHYVINSVKELYAERDVPKNAAGKYRLNLDQHLMRESIELAREEGAKDISSRNPHWLWDYIEIKGGVGFISFDFKKWLERHLR